MEAEHKETELSMEAERKRKAIQYIAVAVLERWANVPYRLRERAGDAAMMALDEGKSISECIEIARKYLSDHT